MDRRDFLKGLTLIVGAAALPQVSVTGLKVIKEFGKYSVDSVPLPNLGVGYRWCRKDNFDKRLRDGYKFVGLKPVTMGELVLMKKVK